MIDFMVLSAPRSGSTWVSNWLTTEHSVCLHDAVLDHRVDELDAVPCDRGLGIACTALALVPSYVNGHPARKVIVHRDRYAIDNSLLSIGCTRLGDEWNGALERLTGMHVAFEDLFDPSRARRIYEHLLQRPFDEPRHSLLTCMHIDPEFSRLVPRPGRARDFIARVVADLAS